MPAIDPNASRAFRPGHRGKRPAPAPAVAAPHRTPLAWDLHPATRAITRAQGASHAAVDRATRRIERHATFPAIPKLAHPTPAQRHVSAGLYAQAARGQGIRTGQEIRALPAAQRKRAERGLGSLLTEQKYAAARYAATHGYSAPNVRALAAAGNALMLGRNPRLHEGRPAPHISAAGLNINIGPAVTFGHNLLAQIAAGHGGGVLSPNIAARFAQGAVKFPVTAVQGGVQLADAARQALGPAGLMVPGAGFLTALSYGVHPGAGRGGGNFAPAKTLAEGIKQSAVETVTHPLKDPFNTALIALGGYGAAGRVLGALGRAGMAAGDVAGASEASGFVRASRALGDTRRAPALPYEGAPPEQAISRSYSRNALTKAVQAHGDRQGNVLTGFAQGRALRSSAYEFGSHEEGIRRLGVQQAADGLVQLVGKSRAGRITSAVGRGGVQLAHAVVRRSQTGDAGPVVDEALARLRSGPRLNRTARDTIAAIVESRVVGRLHGRELTPEEFKRELVAERDRLAQEAEVGRHSWTGEERRLNRLQRRALNKAADDPRVLENAGRLQDVADRIKGTADGLEQELTRLGLLDPKQALIAKVRPVAIARFGYRPITPADRSALSRERDQRVAQYLEAHRVHDQAGIADTRARNVDTLLGLYRLQHNSSGATAAERAAARGKFHNMRESLGLSQDQVRRLAETHGPHVSAEARATRDAAAARLAEHQSTLPPAERAYGDLQAAHERTSRALEASRTELERAQRAEARAMGGEAVRRGQARARGENRGVHASRRRAAARVERAKAAMHDARQAERTARTALEAHRGLPDFSMGLVDQHGQPVTTEDVVTRIQHEGVPMPGYFRQTRGPQVESWFRNWLRPTRTASLGKRRTGAATVRGGHASDWHAMVESIIRRQGDVIATQGWDRFIRQTGVTKEDGTGFTPEEVQPYLEQHGFLDAEGHPIEGMPRMMAVWRFGASADAPLVEDLQAKRALASSREVGPTERLAQRDVIGPADELTHDQAAALEAPHPDARIALVPEPQLRAFSASQQVSSSTIGKAFTAVTNLFRSTVLPFSVKWITGNVLEAFMRLAVSGARLSDLRRGHVILRELLKQDEQAWESLHVRGISGLFFGTARNLAMHSGPERFRGTGLEGVTQGLADFGSRDAVLTGAENPALVAGHVLAVPLRATFEGLRLYTHGVFRLNTWMERQTQIAALGKYGRLRAQEFTGSWIKALGMQRVVAEQVARGLIETPEQIRFARYVDETLGKYARFSPTTRRVIQTVAPFLPWYLNAMRFVYHTLPVKHPVLTAVLSQSAHVLGKDMQPQNVPPGDLEASIPVGGSKYLTLSRYTPFGAFTNGWLDTVTSPILPQAATAFGIAAYGVNFTGRPLDVGGQQQGISLPTGKRALLALNALFESFVPAAQIARRLQEHGATPFDDSWLFGIHTKPDTATGAPFGLGHNNVADAANRILNPFRPVYLHPTVTNAGGSSLPPEVQQAVDKAVGASQVQAVPPEVQDAIDKALAAAGR